MKSKWLWLVPAVAAVALWRSLVFVDETEMVIVTQFGEPVESYRVAGLQRQGEFPWVKFDFANAAPGDAGLRFKMPYQSAIRIDRRLQIYDPRPSEFLAAEKKNVDLDVFVCWQVDPTEPLQFLQTVNDLNGAEARIHDVVWSELAAEVGRSPLEHLVSIDPEMHRLDELVGQVAQRCNERTERAYGIRIIDMRLKRISLPSQVRDSVFQRMRAERARIAAQYRAEGEEEAMKIRAAADKERTVTLAQAYAESEKIRGQGEAEATRIYAEAHAVDPEFYELLRTLEAYRKFLDEKTTVLLSADSELLKYLTGRE
jgi:membrane protease subunit HflC